MAKPHSPLRVDTLTHDTTRPNIPTGELKPLVDDDTRRPIHVEIAERDPDLDPQLVWRGKRQGPLHVQAPPLYIQERIHPKHLIDELQRATAARKAEGAKPVATEQIDLFGDFNGVPEGEAKTEFYRHDAHWTNRMILGDALEVMTSLAEREDLRGKVQCIYIDPPYGIKFNSNFQWSTTSRDVKDGNAEHITREPEQVKAFRDTWRDGIHSYLSYLKDRLMVARELLTESGSCFVQIGDENVHRVRALMDEVFGEENFVSQISFQTTAGRANSNLASASNFILWSAKNTSSLKYRSKLKPKSSGSSTNQVYRLARKSDSTWRRLNSKNIKNAKLDTGEKIFRPDNITSSRSSGAGDLKELQLYGEVFGAGSGTFKSDEVGLRRLANADRIWRTSGNSIQYIRYLEDFDAIPISNIWTDTGTGSFTDDKIYVVQTGSKVIQRCLLMTTDPGDLVLDPTCGSGTTAYVAEQWGRRWITIDTSRVALALTRARIVGARYPWYLLTDSLEGQAKTAEITRELPSDAETNGDIRHGFVYERVPHIMLSTISRNEEIDVLYAQYQPAVLSALAELNAALRGYAHPFPVDTGGRKGETIDFTAAGEVTMPSGEKAPANGFMEWEVPRDAPDGWPVLAKAALETFWQARIKRQREIDASIAAKAEFEYLYDKPYEDKSKVRVAGPFTVESCDPHRMFGVDEHGEARDFAAEQDARTYHAARDFTALILDELAKAGVQQADKSSKIDFDTLEAWPGTYVHAEGQYTRDTGAVQRAAIYVGPEYGTVLRNDIVDAAREAAEAGFDVLVACGFNFDAHATDLSRLGRLPILKARMNADLHMAQDLAPTKSANLFVVFGEPDVVLRKRDDGRYEVEVRGVDIWDPKRGEVRSSEAKDLACWFLDDAYTGEAFHVRHAYFLGANDPYDKLRTTLKAEIDREAWASLNRKVSRPFEAPATGKVAVKVINHLGDEVMKVMGV